MGLSQNVLNKSVRVLDERLKQIIVASSTIMLSEAYKQTMRDIQMKNVDRYFTDLSLLQVPFAQTELMEKSIDSILISTPMGDFYPTTKIRMPNVPFQQTSLFHYVKENEQVRWMGGHRDELFAGGNQVISLLLKPLSEYYVPDVFLTVNVKEDLIRDILKKDMSYDSMSFILLTQSGASVLQSSEYPEWLSDPRLLQKISNGKSGHFEFDSGNGPMLVNYAQSDFAEDWILVGFQSKQDLLQPMRSIQWLILAIMAGCILLALFLARFLSNLLLRPLYTLQRVMKRVEQNDLSARFHSPFQDEISEAGHQFNRMLGTIDQLIAEVRETEKEKRKAEVKALQAQIDPHFLYNTLNTVFWKCEMEEYEDVKEMVVSLSMLFRLGLNNGHEMTTLGKELEHVRQYLYIQQKCYEDLFEYSIEADPELFEVPMLKILLQPLVENSILHGMKKMKEKGIIRIIVQRDHPYIVIRVIDNGMGMNVDRVNQQVDEPSNLRQSYALSNVRSRLQLYYGEEASLTLYSEPYVRTEAVIRFPWDKGGN